MKNDNSPADPGGKIEHSAAELQRLQAFVDAFADFAEREAPTSATGGGQSPEPTEQPDPSAEPPDPSERPLWEIDARILNPFAPLPEITTWGKMSNRPAIEQRGIITISAKPKQGKSLSVYALLASIVSGNPIDTFTPNEQRPRLAIVFDTEMSATTLQRRVKSIYEAIGEHLNRFVVVSLLACPKKERRKVIEDITKRYRPDIVAIDVVTKLVDDFNSPAENSEFGDWLEKYAKDKTVFVVIHQNKAADNDSMKGHLGSILGEAATENYAASKKDGVFTLRPINARDTDAEGAPGVSFILNDDGTFSGAAQVLARNRESEANKWRDDLRPIFGSDPALRHNEITARIMKRQGLTEKAAEKKVRLAKECGAIAKTGAEKTDPYMLTPKTS